MEETNGAIEGFAQGVSEELERQVMEPASSNRKESKTKSFTSAMTIFIVFH